MAFVNGDKIDERGSGPILCECSFYDEPVASNLVALLVGVTIGLWPTAVVIAVALIR